MEMGIEEIKRQYKYAKDRKKCISILAELNCCSKDDIKAIIGLAEKKNDASDNQKVKLSANEIKSLYNRLDELDAAIKLLEDEYKRTAAELMSISKK